jgi:hypothetical protein
VGELDPPLPALTVPQLSYLVAAADAPTFAVAAESLGVTTSALSQGLAELERRIGVGLFERSGRRQVLRPEGAEVLAFARRVIADTGDLARWAASLRSGDATSNRWSTNRWWSWPRTAPLPLPWTIPPDGDPGCSSPRVPTRGR